MSRSLALILFFLVTGSAAHAHGGHLGDLAGHAHWVGLAALIGAAALAALIAKARKNDDTSEPQDAETDSEDEPEGAAT